MKKELDYFTIDGGLGWNQHWFSDWSMYHGGCAAVTACDLSIYLARQKGLSSLYPYDARQLSRDEYVAFAKTMKRYLGPRWKGVDTLELYTSGLVKYWHDVGANSLKVVEVAGTLPWTEAGQLIRAQIDSGLIIPYLLLRHKSRTLRDYHWHWFNIAGYKESDGCFLQEVFPQSCKLFFPILACPISPMLQVLFPLQLWRGNRWIAGMCQLN